MVKYQIIIATIFDPIACLFIKDPCKNCLVKACCSDPCETSIVIKNYCYPFESLQEKKLAAWMVVYSMFALVVTIFALIWKAFR